MTRKISRKGAINTYTIFLDNSSPLFIKTEIESKSWKKEEMKRTSRRVTVYTYIIFLDNAISDRLNKKAEKEEMRRRHLGKEQ